MATFIIDGYNLLYALARGQNLEPLPEIRQRLEARMRAFRRTEGPGTRLIIVYDGERGRAAPPRREKGFEIVFSRPPQEADDVILELCRRLESEPGLNVVTSDFIDIAQKVRGLRVRHWTSEEFAALLAQRLRDAPGAAPSGKKSAGSGEKPSQVPSEEVAEWVRQFGFHREKRE